MKPPPRRVIARLAAPSRATDGVRALPPPDPASQAPLGSPVPEATLAGGLRPPFRTVRAPVLRSWGLENKSAARRVRRAALAPHRAPGAQAVRVICYSCGRTRPATICQAPGCGRDERLAGTSHGAARPPRARAGSGGRRTRHAPRPHSPRTPIALALLMPPTSVACRSSSPGRTSANMPAAARPGTFDGSARRRSRLSASRVSVALRVSCTSRC